MPAQCAITWVGVRQISTGGGTWTPEELFGQDGNGAISCSDLAKSTAATLQAPLAPWESKLRSQCQRQLYTSKDVTFFTPTGWKSVALRSGQVERVATATCAVVPSPAP